MHESRGLGDVYKRQALPGKASRRMASGWRSRRRARPRTVSRARSRSPTTRLRTVRLRISWFPALPVPLATTSTLTMTASSTSHHGMTSPTRSISAIRARATSTTAHRRSARTARSCLRVPIAARMHQPARSTATSSISRRRTARLAQTTARPAASPQYSSMRSRSAHRRPTGNSLSFRARLAPTSRT